MNQITRLEKNMTKGYAAAVKTGGNSFSVEGKKFTGSQVATRLEQAFFTASPDRKFSPDKIESEADNDRLGNITFYKASYGTSDQRQQTTTIHEGLHSIPWIGGGSGSQSHQQPFNDAADEVLQKGQ